MNTHLKKITVLIPCYNEERGVGKVISGFPTSELEAAGFSLEVIVIDNNSTDRTMEVARSYGAVVLHEPKKGKGNAMRCGFNHIPEDTDYVVMLDGDNTYRPDEIWHLLEPLEKDIHDVVIGSRLSGNMVEGSMKKLNHFGNKFFSTLVRYFYRIKVTDVLTGYYAWKKKTIEELRPHLCSEGFSIEMEMLTKMARLRHNIFSVPISYDNRAGETNLRPFQDGMRILRTFASNLFWKPR